MDASKFMWPEDLEAIQGMTKYVVLSLLLENQTQSHTMDSPVFYYSKEAQGLVPEPGFDPATPVWIL